MPSLAIDKDPNDVHITYDTQHTHHTLDLDVPNSQDRRDRFPTTVSYVKE